MSKHSGRGSARPLPSGLRVCDACGEVRGATPTGRVSACFCSGATCNRCGARRRRPITDYYDPFEASWWHVPYFHLMGHRCPADAQGDGERWTVHEAAPEVRAYQEAITRRTLATMAPDAGLDLVDVDRRRGIVPPARC